jgi:hypothetical protein
MPRFTKNENLWPAFKRIKIIHNLFMFKEI